MTRLALALPASLLLLAAPAAAQNATVAGAVTSPYPTLENLSVEWAIEGDADLDGVVTVRYREAGASAWRTGLPLFRVPAGSNAGHSWANRHAGSIFDLRPDTEYEIELTLDDPDGGSETRTLTARTRRIPEAPADARVREVTPGTLAGVLGSAEPGDLILLGAGSYGSFTVRTDGTELRPIVVRGVSAEEVTVTGEVRMDGRSHVYLEDVTVEGQVKFNSAVGIVVRGCTIRTARDGIVSYVEGTTNGYFADNVILGPTVWYGGALGVSGDNLGEGINVTGPGNVIAHNRVVGFRDNISLLEGENAYRQVSIDIIGNDLDGGADDCIEADFAMGNVRVMRNRMTNCFMALSSQPGLGGPTYFVRNVVYNAVLSAFKLQRASIGDVLLHNTVVKCGDAMGIYTSDPFSRTWARNNLFIGGEGGGTYGGYSNGTGRVASMSAAASSCSFDYDGYGSIGTGSFQGRIGDASFASLSEMRSRTTEVHAVQVDMSIFAADVAFPSAGPFPGYDAPDLRLAAGSAAVDRGVALPNVNDGFAGAAPDLGAYEAGSLLPSYGPRSAGAAACGNGVREGDEACDDGNTLDGDGCSSACALEGEPGVDAGPAGTDGGGPPAGDGGAVPGADGGTGTGTAPMDGEVDGGCACDAAAGANRGAGVAFLLAVPALLLLLVRRGRKA